MIFLNSPTDAAPPNWKSKVDLKESLKESLKEEILLQAYPSNQTKLSFNDFRKCTVSPY